jgi:hypothetical protein
MNTEGVERRGTGEMNVDEVHGGTPRWHRACLGWVWESIKRSAGQTAVVRDEE